MGQPCLEIGMSCALSPEKLRAMKVAPSVRPSCTGSMGAMRFGSLRLLIVPTSADAENCPFVSPYTPLFSIRYSIRTLRRIA